MKKIVQKEASKEEGSLILSFLRWAEVSWSSRDIDFKSCLFVSPKMWDTAGHRESSHSPHRDVFLLLEKAVKFRCLIRESCTYSPGENRRRLGGWGWAGLG